MASTLQVRNTLDLSGIKDRALADARRMQAAVDEECSRIDKTPPEYQLSELIGKGSFGRVYKATSLKTQQLVAIKIIDIEQSDSESLNSSQADTYSDLLKEINALQLLGASGAKNINLVIEALPVGQSMWMITEYCAGGSVATLMKPTHPGGLQEKWIVPILREVAEAMHWVHGQGIIHRDVKCANVLVTEAGEVQLCDFGVSGIIEHKLDKRTTVIGTPHWMAPELLLSDNNTMSYGTEVDIWAFGSMVYEIASGYPPNVQFGMDFQRLCNFLRSNAPRLEGDEYSPGLRSLVAYCLQSDPSKRPTIEQIQQHGYIANTQSRYPTSSLSMLVRAYKMWEAQGGSRKSLFFAGGAQGPSDSMSNVPSDDDWNFSTTAAFDQSVFQNADAQAVFEVYGSGVDFAASDYQDEPTAKPARGKASRRRPPQLPKLKAPLEKVFDPNTMSSYHDNSRVYYGRPASPPPPQPTSDLPLRDDSSQSNQVRESLIDLDASLHGSDLSRFVDMETIKGPRASTSLGGPPDHDYNNPPLSDPADTINNNRRTQEWKFPSMATPASAAPVMFRFPFHNGHNGSDHKPATARPGIIHHPTEPVTSRPYNDLATLRDAPANSSPSNRASVSSLIDLDMSLDVTRPSTSHSDFYSSAGSEHDGTAPFEYERAERQPNLYALLGHGEPSIYVESNTDFSASSAREPSIYVESNTDYSTSSVREPSVFVESGIDYSASSVREPSIYVSDDSEFARNLATLNISRPGANGYAHSRSSHYDIDAQSYTSNTESVDVDFLTPQQQLPPAPEFRGPSPQTMHHQQMPSTSQPYHQGPPSHHVPRGIGSGGPGLQRQGNGHMAGFPLPPAPPTLNVMQGQASSGEVREELRRMARSLKDHLSQANAVLESLRIRKATGGRMDSAVDGL